MIARILAGMAALAALILVQALAPAPAFAEQLTPETFTCEKAFGPGYTPHPDFAFSCCWPGRVPIPGKPGCVIPGQENAGPPPNRQQNPTVNNQPSSNIRDAEGRPGAPGGHCIPSGATCTLGGAPCCTAGETCGGKFPNTFCQ